jgi:hypothetical protein
MVPNWLKEKKKLAQINIVHVQRMKNQSGKDKMVK